MCKNEKDYHTVQEEALSTSGEELSLLLVPGDQREESLEVPKILHNPDAAKPGKSCLKKS